MLEGPIFHSREDQWKSMQQVPRKYAWNHNWNEHLPSSNYWSWRSTSKSIKFTNNIFGILKKTSGWVVSLKKGIWPVERAINLKLDCRLKRCANQGLHSPRSWRSWEIVSRCIHGNRPCSQTGNLCNMSSRLHIFRTWDAIFLMFALESEVYVRMKFNG